MKHLWKVYIRLTLSNFREYFRDPLPLLFSFALPLFFVISFGNSSGEAVSTKAIKVLVVGSNAVVDEAYQALADQPVFSVGRAASADPVDVIQMQRAVLVVAAGSPMSPPLALYSAQQNSELATLVGRLLAMPPVSTSPRLETHFVEQGAFDYFKFIFPAIVALSLLQVALFGTAAPIIGAKEKGTYRHFAVVPMPRLALLASQLTVRLLTALVQITILLFVGYVFFDVAVERPLTSALVLLLGSATLICYGYAIAGVFSSLNLASGFLLLLNFYCMTFGQLFIDMSQSEWRWLVPTTPVGFLSDALRQTLSGLDGMYSLLTDIYGLACYLLFSAFIGIKYFQFSPKVA